MKWFKHDSNASSDAKILRVRMKYGMEGYGLYWHCLELIVGAIDESNLTFELEHDAEIISHQTGIHYERVQEMMAYMVEQGLFENRNGNITCMKLLKRLDKSMTSNKSFRAMLDAAKENHDSVMTESDSVMQDLTTQDLTTQKKIRAAKRVPAKWTPSDDGLDFALEQGMDQPTTLDQLDQFRDHEFKTPRKDWDACWRTWCRNWKKWRKDEKDIRDSKPNSFEAIQERNRKLAGLD